MLATATYAALLKESRTQYINATVLNRKSGGWNSHTADRVGLAPMVMPRTPTTLQGSNHRNQQQKESIRMNQTLSHDLDQRCLDAARVLSVGSLK
jgi:hypothetical protein